MGVSRLPVYLQLLILICKYCCAIWLVESIILSTLLTNAAVISPDNIGEIKKGRAVDDQNSFPPFLRVPHGPSHQLQVLSQDIMLDQTDLVAEVESLLVQVKAYNGQDRAARLGLLGKLKVLQNALETPVDDMIKRSIGEVSNYGSNNTTSSMNCGSKPGKFKI